MEKVLVPRKESLGFPNVLVIFRYVNQRRSTLLSLQVPFTSTALGRENGLWGWTM